MIEALIRIFTGRDSVYVTCKPDWNPVAEGHSRVVRQWCAWEGSRSGSVEFKSCEGWSVAWLAATIWRKFGWWERTERRSNGSMRGYTGWWPRERSLTAAGVYLRTRSREIRCASQTSKTRRRRNRTTHDNLEHRLRVHDWHWWFMHKRGDGASRMGQKPEIQCWWARIWPLEESVHILSRQKKRRLLDSRTDQGWHRRFWIRRCSCSYQVGSRTSDFWRPEGSDCQARQCTYHTCEQSRWRFSIQRKSGKRNQEGSKYGENNSIKFGVKMGHQSDSWPPSPFLGVWVGCWPDDQVCTRGRSGKTVV